MRQYYLVASIFSYMLLQCFLMQTQAYLRSKLTRTPVKKLSNTNSAYLPMIRQQNPLFFLPISYLPTLSKTELNMSLKAKRKPILSRFVSWILCRVVRSSSQFVSGLKVDVIANSNFDIIRGRVKSVQLKFDKICFGQLYVTGGGRLTIQGLNLRMRRFLFLNKQSLRRPYKITGDLLLTQQDIVNSKLIRNLLQMLANTIMEEVLAKTYPGILRVDIKKVTIRSKRLFVQGEARSSIGAFLAFELSSGAGVREEGQVLALENIQVVLNPESQLRTAVPIDVNRILSAPIDVDLGDNCRIQQFTITNNHVWLRLVSLISHVEPFEVVNTDVNKNSGRNFGRWSGNSRYMYNAPTASSSYATRYSGSGTDRSIKNEDINNLNDYTDINVDSSSSSGSGDFPSVRLQAEYSLLPQKYKATYKYDLSQFLSSLLRLNGGMAVKFWPSLSTSSGQDASEKELRDRVQQQLEREAALTIGQSSTGKMDRNQIIKDIIKKNISDKSTSRQGQGRNSRGSPATNSSLKGLNPWNPDYIDDEYDDEDEEEEEDSTTQKENFA